MIPSQDDDIRIGLGSYTSGIKSQGASSSSDGSMCGEPDAIEAQGAGDFISSESQFFRGFFGSEPALFAVNDAELRTRAAMAAL